MLRRNDKQESERHSYPQNHQHGLSVATSYQPEEKGHYPEKDSSTIRTAIVREHSPQEAQRQAEAS